MKSLKVVGAIVLAVSAMLINNAAVAGNNDKGRRSIGSPVVYVIEQERYYDSIVLTDLPRKGNFQQLFPTSDGLMTEFGPGDITVWGVGYKLDRKPGRVAVAVADTGCGIAASDLERVFDRFYCVDQGEDSFDLPTRQVA